MSTHNFEAETWRILELLTHSIYSNKEIFLREIISNAADAVDKAKLKSLTDTNFLWDDAEFQITVEADKENELLLLLQQLFDFDLEKDVPIKIKGDLTEDKLNNEIMVNIKKTIKKMYIGCEVDFQRGIQIYNQIYKQRNHM